MRWNSTRAVFYFSDRYYHILFSATDPFFIDTITYLISNNDTIAKISDGVHKISDTVA